MSYCCPGTPKSWPAGPLARAYGKSLAALFKLHLTSLLVPGCSSMILRATHTSLTASTLVTFEKQVARQEIESGEVKWYGGSGSKPPGYRYANGSVIYAGGLDRPGRLLSMELDRIFIDEANQVSETAYQTALTRLRGNAPTYKQLTTACNPDAPSHYLYQRSLEGQLRLIPSLHQDNPRFVNLDGSLTEEGVEYMAKLDALTGIRRTRYRDGVWAAAEGLVFDDWREGEHIIEASGLPDDYWVLCSVDWGFQNALVWQEWWVDPDGRMYLAHEVSLKNWLVEDFAREFQAYYTDRRRPAAVVADHDAEDRATFERHSGYPTIAARKAVSTGVQAVQNRLRKDASGRPQLFVARGALVGRDPVAEARKTPRGVLGEIGGYVWSTERGSDGIPKEAPLKQNDHSMDAMRYAVMYLDGDLPGAVGNPARARQAQPARASVWSRPVGK